MYELSLIALGAGVGFVGGLAYAVFWECPPAPSIEDNPDRRALFAALRRDARHGAAQCLPAGCLDR